ncbi:hypothetical protein N7467_004143 [Penicillium canescens]|nr:hypothetical protein N7467_004143 [Penicillium canescens]
MAVQGLGERLPNRGRDTSWSLHHAPQRDSNDGRIVSEVYYLQQNANSGYLFFGDEKTTPAVALISNDSEHQECAVEHLRDKLPALFGLQRSATDCLISNWTGVMGFTADGLPLVGRVPSSVSGRHGQAEWIAAGFNGMDMSMCTQEGEAIARMALDEDIADWFPEAYKLSPSWLQNG